MRALTIRVFFLMTKPQIETSTDPSENRPRRRRISRETRSGSRRRRNGGDKRGPGKE